MRAADGKKRSSRLMTFTLTALLYQNPVGRSASCMAGSPAEPPCERKPRPSHGISASRKGDAKPAQSVSEHRGIVTN